jgi:hypothetical protein
MKFIQTPHINLHSKSSPSDKQIPTTISYRHTDLFQYVRQRDPEMN